MSVAAQGGVDMERVLSWICLCIALFTGCAGQTSSPPDSVEVINPLNSVEAISPPNSVEVVSPPDSVRVLWSYNAMAAVPTRSTLERKLYETWAGRALFRKGKTGILNLICPVSENLDGFRIHNLVLTYQDGDGPHGPAETRAVLRWIRRSDGHVETIENGAVSSNDTNAPDSGMKGWASNQSASSGETMNHVVDFENHYYYVQITMKRNNAAVPLGAIGVYLTN